MNKESKERRPKYYTGKRSGRTLHNNEVDYGSTVMIDAGTARDLVVRWIETRQFRSGNKIEVLDKYTIEMSNAA